MTKHYKEHIYSLEDRNESDISPLWQILQVLFFMCCIMFGYAHCYSFGLAMSTTQFNCILYSNLSFTPNHTDTLGRSNNIRAVNSEFPSIYCDLVLYVPVVVSTFASFFAVMFAYCGRGGAGNQSVQETWRIIMPTIFFNLISLCLIAYTVDIFQLGLKQFLRSVAATWSLPVINLDEINHLCLDGSNIGRDLIRYMSLTKQITWLLVSFWGLNFLWVLLRFLFNVDFQLVRTTIHVYPKKPNVVRTIGKAYRTSVSETSTFSLEDTPRPSAVRFRTVQFTPSTIGPAAASPVLTREPSSEADVDGSDEVQIGEVTYNTK